MREVDLVVVGAGAPGLTAAVTAADAGLDVLILERADKVGGVAGVSGGAVWLPLTRFGAAPDTREQVLAYLDFLAAGYGTRAHRERFADASPAVAHYLADQAGVKWRAVEGHVDNFHPWAPGTVVNSRMLEVEPIPGAELGEWQSRTIRSQLFPPGLMFSEMRDTSKLEMPLSKLLAQRVSQDMRACGEGLSAYLVKAALVERKIPVLLSTRADALIVEDGAVVGVQTADGAAIRARRGVILATGGYDWNLQGRLESVPGYGTATPPTVTGDHLVMACEIGAATTALPPLGMHTQYGYVLEGEEFEGKPLWRWAINEVGAPHAIIVNDQGERFCDEAFFFQEQSRLLDFDPVQRRYRNLPAYVIFDQNHRDKTRFGPFAAGVELPDSPFVRADSVPELAEALGISADGLQNTINRFNKFCAAGVDEDFGRGDKGLTRFLNPVEGEVNPVLGPIERGPFYALPLQLGGLGSNLIGLTTDVDGRVMHVRGRPIPGLYAVSNAAAHQDFGPSYVSGGLIARGLAGAYVAARHASGLPPVQN
ncbi:hypothetical protein MPHL43072_02275 [Mycolicibacterium phlei DSM 43072]|uniref:FAD-dependent oxidoreductase 2 FAD-binding domain-containing protein n=1 Tax=Mycolicibacterium phlei DSM 43239 = CCUG 21000 TaxID=1226750 RepID=A0A5N5UYR9_MYCPH|nr:FAD-dependent oxidoreductase [Mycolicibacterium phlei]KXW69478.1 hypothetical protein MPHL43070_18645 [Mycolicibacterium phlei DSM 43070]KXW72630.1 hypothetical protein MPHL43072_02275 [Mycolicibacterium phlei DSM 43072]KXW79011.1 hypothetical protein JL15_02795 [Mycolicibacterium phlei DSM 43071]KAB7754795.1 hypothetical protein MPHL21000_16615 [Mycolicibacterium phlei DSM 43239 = CCUG 21000]KXW65490.1 hypothetical protein MPHL43239_12440 [Mycolicibacterium phlei DSM 43239 = CCUG 21000]